LLAWLQLDAIRFKQIPEADVKRAYESAHENAERAVALDPKSVRALQALSSITFYGGDYGTAEQIQRQALALNPNDPDTLAQLGWRLAVRGNWDEGIGYLRQAIDRTISPPGWYYHLVAVHAYLQGNYADAITAAEISGRNGSSIGLSIMAMSQAALGDIDEARKSLETLENLDPGFLRDPAAAYRTHHPIDEILSALLDGLRKAGWKEPVAATRP
jgi:tetratricopeptide (TPR) repeat protein